MSPHLRTPPVEAAQCCNSNAITENIQTKQRLEILYDGNFYDVTNWIPYHPGGSVIKFYTEKGEDATIPVQQFHYRFLPKVLSRMESLKKRQASEVECKLFQKKIKTLLTQHIFKND